MSEPLLEGRRVKPVVEGRVDRVLSTEELRTPDFWRAVFAEFLATQVIDA
jgi:hypothetical protein